jgi:phosphohistidine phosphatase
VFKELYLASPQRLLEQIEGVPAAATTLLVVAHNPGIGALAHHFAEGAEVALHQQILASYPPAALSVFDSGAADWRGFKASRLLLEFVRPEDL